MRKIPELSEDLSNLLADLVILHFPYRTRTHNSDIPSNLERSRDLKDIFYLRSAFPHMRM